MADIAGLKGAAHPAWPPASRQAQERAGESREGDGPARADVDRQERCLPACGGTPERPHHVIDMHEIPHDAAVLEDLDRPFLNGKTGETGKDAGIGVGKGLTRPIDVVQPQNDGVDPASPEPLGDEMLLHELGRTVDRDRIGQAVTGGGGPAVELPAIRAEHVEAAPFEHGAPAWQGESRSSCPIHHRALAIDRPRTGEDDAVGLRFRPADGLDQARRADDVHIHMPTERGMGLAGAGLGGQVKDDLGPEAAEEPGQGGLVADVGRDETRPCRLDALSRRGPVGVNLRMEIVENDDFVSGGEGPDEAGADEAGAADDEDAPALEPVVILPHDSSGVNLRAGSSARHREESSPEVYGRLRGVA